MFHRILLPGLAALGLLALAAAGLAPAPADSDEVESYRIDSVHSSIAFRIQHLGVSYFYGRFNQIVGQFTFDKGNPAKSSIEVQIKADSVDTNDEKRDAHVKSPDFLSVEEFPVVKFKSQKIQKKSGNTYKVEGELTLHGQTRPLTIEVDHVGSGKDPWGGYRTGFDTTFTVKRSDFGMGGMMNVLGDEIRIHLGIEGTRR